MLIAQEMQLIALDGESGTLEKPEDYALAGALLVELALLGRVELDRHAPSPGHLTVRSGPPTGHPELDGALVIVAQRASKPTDADRAVFTWPGGPSSRGSGRARGPDA